MRRLAVLLGVMLLVGAARGAWEPNLVDSPSAEDDRNRDGGPDGWAASAFRSPAKLAWDDAVAHSGKRSLRISDSAAEGTEWSQYTGRWISAGRKKVTPGQTYTLGAWIKTDGVTGYASARIAWWQDGHWLAESRTENVGGTTDWRHMTVTVKAPAKATEAQVYLGLGNSKGTVWFDDVAHRSDSRRHVTRASSMRRAATQAISRRAPCTCAASRSGSSRPSRIVARHASS